MSLWLISIPFSLHKPTYSHEIFRPANKRGLKSAFRVRGKRGKWCQVTSVRTGPKKRAVSVTGWIRGDHETLCRSSKRQRSEKVSISQCNKSASSFEENANLIWVILFIEFKFSLFWQLIWGIESRHYWSVSGTDSKEWKLNILLEKQLHHAGRKSHPQTVDQSKHAC